jgi:hypothetical protein
MEEEIKTLTKENFWNDAFKRWPDQVAAFCKWIDEYKVRVDWKRLFAVRTYTNYDDGTRCEMELRQPKYHDLPIAMQIGIFIQFTFEYEKQEEFFEVGPTTMDEFIAGMKDWFDSEKALAFEAEAREKHLNEEFGTEDYELGN